ncbi:MAG: hypothetical protein Wins2KO_05600 [Winogradskyella sp.]
MKIRLVLLNILLIGLISCGGDTPKDVDQTDKKEQQQPLITAKAIEQFKFNDYVLSLDGEKAVENWEKYQELSIQIGYLRKADLSFFIGEKEMLKEFINKFVDEIPEELSQNPIFSRVAIVQTTVLRLNENLALDNIGESMKLEGVKEVLIAFSNLNYQINKKLERDKYDKIKSEY